MVLPKNSANAEYSSSSGHDWLVSLKTNSNQARKTAITVDIHTDIFNLKIIASLKSLHAETSDTAYPCNFL
jgi:hypothetical protein